MENKITKETIREAVEYVFNRPQVEAERRISGVRGCITRGWVDIMDFSHCGDESCPNCGMMQEALNREMTALFKNIPVEKSKGRLLEELDKISVKQIK